MECMGKKVKDMALELEDVVDSHVSHQILSQMPAGDQSPLKFSLDFQGVRKDVHGFTEKMNEIERVFNHWFEEQESNIFGLKASDDEHPVTRTRFLSWFATKAASVFIGVKEDYFQDLENLFLEELEEEEEGENDYALLLRNDFYVYESWGCYNMIKEMLSSWWMDKVASIDDECIQESDNSLPEESDNAAVSPVAELPVNMVGLADLFCKIRNELIEDSEITACASIIGMAGIGKSALAKKILQDPLISSKFERLIFVRVGSESQFEQVMQLILAGLNLEYQGVKMQMKAGDEDLVELLNKAFHGRKYLIVLDDVWNKNLLVDIRRTLPQYGGSWILVTSRIKVVAADDNLYDCAYKVPFLDINESWDLLRAKIFGEDFRCPYELEKAGKKIAENCEGLPLLIVTVAHLLSKGEKTLQYWSKVAANKTNDIFIDAYEKILKVLDPSYHHLPQHLKTCFLYMGAFPQNCKVRISKLINLWSAERFLDFPYPSLQQWVVQYFDELVDNHNVALALDQSIILENVKVCSLHSVFWYLSKNVGRDERFLHVLNSYEDAVGVDDIRRLSIYKNILFIIKDVRDSIASSVRSLLCTGPYHQYQVPICFGLRLLKVLDAVTIRFYEFPLEVVRLFHLRYLALTCNGSLPPSISNLWNLQCLIVDQHQRINNGVSYLPVEIWELQELEYLQIMGRNLPDPPPGVVLSKLIKLKDVGAQTCTERVLTSIPNLEKLRVRVELMPDAAHLPNLFADVSHLDQMDSLQCVVVNPTIAVGPVPSAFALVRKLTLSGLGYPWEDMTTIAKSMELQELRLKCYAFQGETWEVEEGEFQSLLELHIEDTDLVEWGGVDTFPNLSILTIKNCYKLQEFPEMPSLMEMRVVDCNPCAESYAKCVVPGYCDIYVDSFI